MAYYRCHGCSREAILVEAVGPLSALDEAIRLAGWDWIDGWCYCGPCAKRYRKGKPKERRR